MPQCAELVASHELLLEGTRLLPKVQLRPGEGEVLARRITAAIVADEHPFRSASVELASREPLAMASRRGPALAVISLVVATAAAVLIAVSPWFRDADAPQPNNGPDPNHVAKEIKSELPADPTLDLPPANLLIDPGQEPIAWVGYQMADGLKPVTSSMVEKMREWRKRPPIFYNDESPRSSRYLLDEATSGLS